eukprot:2657782-Pyramimonas_sp.AAC.1
MDRTFSGAAFLERGEGSIRSVGSVETASATGGKVKCICKYGGEFVYDGEKALYVGGENKLVTLNNKTTFAQLVQQLQPLVGSPTFGIKYQLPDMDDLVKLFTERCPLVLLARRVPEQG